MGKRRLKVSRIDGRRYRYPYPVYFRPPLRWITSSLTAKKVAVVARDFGPQILRAIHQNDLENLQRILERRLKADFLITKLCTMDVGQNIHSKRESCPLIVAAQKKDPTILQYMLEKGADPNYVETRTAHDPYRFCALHAAVRRGLLKTTSVLLDAQADPDVIDSRGDSPVHIAVRADDCATVRLLLSRGADPNAKDKHGNTPLHIATGHGNLEIVSILLDYGGRLDVPNQHGEFPIHVAASSGHAHLLNALSVPDANVPSVIKNVMQYPLHLAAENGNANVVQALLESGAADVGVKDSNGNTALHRLVLNPYEYSTMKDMNYFIGAAVALIKAGVDVGVLNTRGETALSLASSNHFPAVAKLIHASGKKEFSLEPEMVQKILIEQNIISSDDRQQNVKNQKQENFHGSPSARPPVPKISPETSSRNISESLLVDMNGGPDGKKQTVLSEAETESNEKKGNSTASTQSALSNEELKRYPLRKSDLWNYQQFQSNPKQQTDVSSFSVTTNKRAERMCIVFDKTSPNTQKASDSMPQKGGAGHESQIKRSRSTDSAKPFTKRSTSAESKVQDDGNKNQAQRLSTSELRQLDNDVKQEKWESYFYPGKAKSEQALRSTGDRANENEEDVWLEHQVGRYMTVSPVALKDLGMDPPSSLRYHSKSPSGFLSEGGGLRRLKLRVAGEVPKAYTCREKAAARKAFILARPVGIENVGDYDRGHLSMSSLPEFGGEAWERAMQRRAEWTEPPKPIFTKYGSLTSTEFPAANVTPPQPNKTQQLDYRIAGLCPQPYKSFGKIETKTDAIEEALLDYETEEEYEIDDDDDMEPLMGESFDEKAPHEWHPMDQEPEKHFDKTEDYEHKVTNLDISLNDSLSSIEADVIAERILKELQDAKEKEDAMQETPTLIEDTQNNDRNIQHQPRTEYDKYNSQNVDLRVPSGKSNSAVLLNLLHGYHPRRNKYETMVVSSVEPEIQRLTVDNIVIADSSTSDDEQVSDISAIETKAVPQTFQTKADDVSPMEGRRKADDLQDKHIDKEVEQSLRTGETDIPVQVFETVSAVQEPDRKDINEENGTADSVNRNLKSKKTVVDTDDNKYANETEISETKRQKEAGEKKPKKGKKSSKKQAIIEDAAGNEDVPYIDSAEVKGSQGKPKTKSKNKRKQEEQEEPASRMQQPEAETKKSPVSPQVDLSNEEVLYSSYSEEPGKRRHRNENDRLSDMNDREEGKDSDYDTYTEASGRRRKTGHGRQYPINPDDALSYDAIEKDSQESGKDDLKKMKPRNKEADTGSEPAIHPVSNEEQGSQSIWKDGSDEVLTSARELDVSKGPQELQNELDVNTVADVVAGKTKTKRKKRKELPVTTDDSAKEVGKTYEPETVIVASVEESSDHKQRILRDADSKTYNEDDKENEVLDLEAADNKSKQESKKRKKKVRDKLEDVNKQNLDIQDEHSVPTGNESIDDSVSKETDSRKILSQSSDSEPVKVGSTSMKKGKRSKSITKDSVSKDAVWNTGAIHEEVWQEAMREEPLASSETIYDAMKLNDAKAQKKSKGASSKAKLRKDGLARDGFPTDQISSEFTGDESSQTNNWIDSQTADVPTSHPPRPVKETDIDDEIANWENYANSWSMTDEKFQSFDMKSPDREHRTIETSVDDIMDEFEDVKEVVAEKVAALYHRSNEINLPPSSGDMPLHISTGAGKQTPIETNIDDDYEENPPYPEAEEFESAVEKSLETNIDDFIEEFSSVTSKENTISDIDKYNRLNVKDPFATSRASKVTNIDDIQVEALTSEQLGQKGQTDLIVPSRDDANFTNEAPVNNESLETPLRRKGSKKKGQKAEKHHKPEERVDVAEPKDEAIESSEIVPQSTKTRKGQKKKKGQNQLEDSSQQENLEELLGTHQQKGKQQRPAKETSIDDDIYLSCEDELKPVNEQVIDDKNFDDKDLLKQEMDEKTETSEGRESYLDQHVKQKRSADYLKIKRFEESESIESEHDLEEDVENMPKTFSLGTDVTKKLKEKAQVKRNKETQEDLEKLGLEDEFRRQKKTKKQNKEVAHAPDKRASNVEFQSNEETSLPGMDYTETAVDEAAEDALEVKKKQEETEEAYYEDSGQDEDWGEKVTSDKDWHDKIIPDDIQSKKVASAKSQLERFIPSDEGEDDVEEEDAKYNAPKTFSLDAVGGKKLRVKSVITDEQKNQQAGDDFEEYKRGKKTKKHRKEVDNTASKNEIKSYEEEEEESVLSGKDFNKIPAHEDSVNIQGSKKKGKQAKGKDFTETDEYTQEEISNKKFPSDRKQLEKFIPSDNSEDDEEEKEDEGKALSAFIPGIRNSKEKTLLEEKKGTEHLPGDEFDEYKRNKKTRKHPKGMVSTADKIRSLEEKLDKKIKAEGDSELKELDKLKARAKQAEETVLTEAGQDEDWLEDKIHEVRSEKFNAVKKELQRFRVSDESEEEEDEDDVEDVEHKAESFGKDAQSGKKMQEKPSAAQEAEPLEENEQYQRRKKPNRPMLKTLYDQDVSEENEHIPSDEDEKFPKKDDKKIDLDRGTTARLKDAEHKKSKKIGFKEEEEDDSSDEQEFEEKKQKRIVSVKRYEEATASDDSEDDSQGNEKSTPKSFNISAAANVKKLEKNIVDNKNEIIKSVKDDPADDFEEFQRRKKPKRPALNAGPTETNIDDDIDETELESSQRKPPTIQTNLDELSTDEESGDENVHVLQQKLDKIKKLDKEFVSDDESDEELEEEDNVPKTFIIGDKPRQKIAEKQTAKDMKKDVDKFAVTKADSTRKHQKAQNLAADGENKMSWKHKTESETDEESDEDRTEFDKLPKKRFEISRFKEDSSFSKESDDNQENGNILPDILPIQISDKKDKMQKNILAKQEGEYSNSRIESKKENEWQNEETDDDDDEEEEIEEKHLKNNVKEIGRNNERNLKHHPVTKNVGRTSQSQEDEDSEETSNKDVESEEFEIFEHRRRPKSTRDRQANKAAPDVQKGGLHFAAASQKQKTVSETVIDNLSGSDYSGENDEKITAKIESLLSRKKPFSTNEDEVESDEPSLIKDDDIARLVETSSKETSKQMYRPKESTKKSLQETSIDDDTPHDSQRKTQNVREVNGVRENVDVKKQQERNKQEKRTFETDDSEEVGESFSRNQLGRVSRVRQKKGMRKTIAALDASSNADTEGESTEDSRRRSAGVPGSKKRVTKEQIQVDMEITDESASCQTSTPNSASLSQKPPPSLSPLSDSDSFRRDGSFKGKMQEGIKSKVPARVLNADDDASNDLDLDASIRQKRRMEMTETVTTKTVTTTKTTPDSKTTGKQTAESLYSLPNRSNRQPPKKRDIQSMGTTSDSAVQETTFDFEPLPGTTKGRLDMSLPENLLSKNEPLKRVSLDTSLLRKSTTGEKTSQDRTTRQHSAESLPHHQNRSRSSEFEGKTHSDANLTRRRPHSTRSRSTSNLDSRASYNGLYRTHRESGQQAFSTRQQNRSLTQVAFETIAANSVNERHLLKKILSEKPVVYTRGIYRPQPVYWRGSIRGANPNDESRIFNRPEVEQLGVSEVNDDAPNKTGDSLDISRQNGVLESSPSSPPQLSASMEGDGDDSEKRNSAFVAYNKRVTIHENQQQQQQRQFYVGNRRRRRHHRSSRSPHQESYKAPRITEPNAVDFSKYGLVAQIWMEQVDMKTVLKSKTMYLTIMPEGVQPPDKITKSLKYEPTGDDLTLPPQWIIARGRTFRQQKRQLDEYRYRMSEGHNLSDSDLDLSRSGRPMSPGGRQELLFFKVGGRWPELAWVLFEGVQTDSATVRMVKDIQLKNPSKLTDQIQDMMTRWWKQKGEAATIEELKRSLDIINIPFIQDETFNPRHANSFFEEEPKLTLEEVDSRDPDVSRMIQEYNLNASFHVDQRRSPHTPQAFSSDALLQQTQLKGLETHSSPNLRHSRLRTRMSEGHDDSQSKDESVARLNTRNSSFRPFSSQDSIDAENLADGKRKSFTIVQSKPKNKGKKEKFGHESNI